MCRAEVTEPAAVWLALLLADICAALCAETGTDPEQATVGPVDFGWEEE